MNRETRIFVNLAFVFIISMHLPLRANDCMTAQCHTRLKEMKQLHFPAGNNCARCHEKTASKEHRFSLTDQVKVCFQCHDENRKGKYIHGAIASSQCVSCHNPHGGSYKAYLKTERIDTGCLECHDKESMSKKVKHSPLRSGDCTACHKPHASDYPALLIAKKEGICFRCHKDKDFSKSKLKVHSVLQEGCGGCHNPHSSDYGSLLTAAPERICGNCHDDIAKKAKTVKVKHPILEQEKYCMNCHEPHVSKFEFNLKESQVKLCLGCHTTPLTYTFGKLSYSVNRVMKNNPVKHGPLADGECSQCHDPHGSDFFRILSSPYPRSFYSEFSTDAYGLCFQCHDSSLATEKVTTQATNFRDGTRNLHYVHVNRKKGRTCRACHEVHAGKTEKLILEKTPFGKWDLPIGFKKTAAGGSCKSGCHKIFTYNREVKGEVQSKLAKRKEKGRIDR